MRLVPKSRVLTSMYRIFCLRNNLMLQEPYPVYTLKHIQGNGYTSRLNTVNCETSFCYEQLLLG